MKPMNTAQEFVQKLLANANPDKDYKALHANRGTPPRPRFSRDLRKVSDLHKGRHPGLPKGCRP